MSLSVRLVSHHDQVPAELWAAGFNSPLEGEWWYRALEASQLEDQFTFLYAVIEDDGAPVALAPMFLTDVPMELVAPEELMPALRVVARFYRPALYQRTLFVGSPCADEGTIAVVPGADRAEAFLALAKAMPAIARQHRAPMLAWKDLPADYRPDMERVIREAGFFITPSYPGTQVHFASADKADYFAGMKGTHRQNLKKRLRKSAELVAVETSVVQAPSPEVLAEIYALFHQTYEKATTRFERLEETFFEAIAAEAPSHFILVREKATGDLLAFMLCFVVGEAVINKFIGIDYRRPREWMLYFRLWDAAVDFALARGAKLLQSGQTGYRPKLEVGHALVPLDNYARHLNPLIHFVYAQVGKTLSWASLDKDLAEHVAAGRGSEGARPQNVAPKVDASKA